MRQRGPHLLAVDDPFVAVPNGSSREAGHVGPGAGLAEQLAPDLLAGKLDDDPPQNRGEMDPGQPQVVLGAEEGRGVGGLRVVVTEQLFDAVADELLVVGD